MDWGTIAVVVLLNTALTALGLTAGLWYLKRRVMASLAGTDVGIDEARDVEAGQAVEEFRHRRRPVEAASESEPHQGGRKVRLREHLEPLGGVPGSLSGDQDAAVRALLGRGAPIGWMSDVQAEALLAAGDYAEAVVDSRIGFRDGLQGRHKIVRRLALIVVADPRARDFVLDWAGGRYSDESMPADPLEEEIWAWIQQHAARLLEARGHRVEAA
jgi:hypothetical protein